jgi:hypothetical protein
MKAGSLSWLTNPKRRMAFLAVALGCLQSVQADPTIISPPPSNGASPSAAVVFVFSEAMDTEFTAASFYQLSPFAELPVAQVWSSGDTVLTCTPTPAFPTNTTIVWSMGGQNPNGDPLGEPTGGAFTTGTGGGSGGSSTNAITTFSVGKVHHYNQTYAGAATLDPIAPYGFSGVTALASNRTATSVSLTLPTAAVSNLIHLPPPSAEVFILSTYDTNLSAYDATFPSGNYSFFVQGSSNQTVMVSLPTTNSMPQPNAPHLTNYPAAQVVNASQAFVLGWDAFSGGTAADYIDVDIGSIYNSPEPGQPGALPGTARTFTIPANTLQPNTNYLSRVGFFRHSGMTNASYTTAAYRATYTEFTLITIAAGPLILTNPVYASGTFSFDVLCSSGQTVVVEYKTNLAVAPWQTLLTTNSPGSSFHAVAPQAVTNRSLFFRARNGP